VKHYKSRIQKKTDSCSTWNTL